MKLIVTFICIYILTGINFTYSQVKMKEDLVSSKTPISQSFNMNLDIDLKFDSIFNSQKKIDELEQLIQTNKNSEALAFLEKHSIDNNSFLLPFSKGAIHLYDNNFNDSYKEFETSIKLTSNDSIKSQLYYILSVIDLKKEKPYEALSNMTKSYKLDSLNLNKIIILGVFNAQLKIEEKEIYYFEKAIKINPKLNNLKNNLAFIYQNKGMQKKAIRYFSEIIKDELDSPLAYNNRGYSYLKLGDFNKALKDINKSIKILPENSYAYRNRALVYIATKDFDKACNDIETALNLGYEEKYGTDLSIKKSNYCK